jgi:hypothetical protein
VALLTLSLFGVTGCGSDNEAEANKLAKTAGDPGPPNPKGIPKESVAPTASGVEAFAQQGQAAQRQQLQTKGTYPGGKK